MLVVPPRCQRASCAHGRASQMIQSHHREVMPLDHARRDRVYPLLFVSAFWREVELIGFEPTTLGLQSRCSPN